MTTHNDIIGKDMARSPLIVSVPKLPLARKEGGIEGRATSKTSHKKYTVQMETTRYP